LWERQLSDKFSWRTPSHFIKESTLMTHVPPFPQDWQATEPSHSGEAGNFSFESLPAQQHVSQLPLHQQVPSAPEWATKPWGAEMFDRSPYDVSRPRFMYMRPQKGHSLILHLLFGWIVLYIPAIYYTVSPNHYWHA
jgi:hypothetical protein